MSFGLVLLVLSSIAGCGEAQPAPNHNGLAEARAPCDHAGDAPATQVAFPAAQGFGRFARGGRGGAVFQVTSLDNSGPGTLRDCAEASGPRTCIFRVSGTIALDDWIKVKHPFLTIAGQTSPGGIALRIRNATDSPMLVQTHDVVIRYLRLRPGPSAIRSTNVDTIQVSGGAHDVILDHLSTSWPTDEGINIVGPGHGPAPCGPTRNVTVQWSILSEGLNVANREAHSRGTYFGYGAENVSFIHNLIASNMRRNPLINTRGQFDMINNVIYNSGAYNGEFYTRFGDLKVNVIGNAAIAGPSSRKNTQLYLVNYFRDYPADFSIYLSGNLDLHRRTDSGDQRLVLEPSDWKYVSSSPVGQLSVPASAITGPSEAYRAIAVASGATRPRRDAVDRRVIGEMLACRGAIINDPAEVGGWPDLSGPPAPPDRDQDGMPDTWELKHGLSPTNPADRNGTGPAGYTNLESYLNELAGDGTDMAMADLPVVTPDPTCGFAIAAAPPLPSVSLTVSPASIVSGGSAELRWSGNNLLACKVEGEGPTPFGSMVVSPEVTTAYQVSCIGRGGGDAIDSVLLRVKPRAAS
jgi:pectate lyase